MFCFKEKPSKPLRVETDTVIPLNHHDDNWGNRSVMMLFLMRFDDVLDPEMLHSSLVKLLSRDDWRLLGARLRLNDRGKLEYHIPERFDANRRAVSYSHMRLYRKISEDPIARGLPKAPSSGGPAVVADTDDFNCLALRPENPHSIDDFLYYDEPQLSMNIISFDDATLVSLNWCHTLLDGMGRAELITAWCHVLRGEDDQVKPLMTADPLADIGKTPTEPYKHAHRKMNLWQSIRFVLNYLWEIFRYPEVESRVVCVPAAYMRKLKADVNAELAAAAYPHHADDSAGEKKKKKKTKRGEEHHEEEEEEEEKTMVASDGDVLTALIAKAVVPAKQPRRPNQPISVQNAFGLRWMLEGATVPRGAAYVGNAITMVSGVLRAGDIAERPLSWTAGQVRLAIRELATKGQIEARLAIDKASLRNNRLALWGPDPSIEMVTVSNWSKGRFFEIADFSPAIVRRREAGAGDGVGDGDGDGDDSQEDEEVQRPDQGVTATPPGRPSYIHGNMFSPRGVARNAFPIIGKDAAGNYWWFGPMRKGLWARVEENLRAL